jgi:hypothetical protein
MEVRILGYRSPQRFVVKRVVQSAVDDSLGEYPDLKVKIFEIKDYREIEQYTPILIYPSLVINHRLCCNGRFPSKAEVKNWLVEMLNEDS